MTDKLEELSYDWSLIDGQGLVRVVPIDSYKTGFIFLTRIGTLADDCNYYPELTLSREKVTITIDTEDESAAYALAAAIDKLLPPYEAE